MAKTMTTSNDRKPTQHSSGTKSGQVIKIDIFIALGDLVLLAGHSHNVCLPQSQLDADTKTTSKAAVTRWT